MKGNTEVNRKLWTGAYISLEIVEEALKEGADINYAASNGASALHNAIDSEHNDIVEFLLKNGANPLCRNNFDGLPLHVAAKKGNLDIINTLLAHNILAPYSIETIQECFDLAINTGHIIAGASLYRYSENTLHTSLKLNEFENILRYVRTFLAYESRVEFFENAVDEIEKSSLNQAIHVNIIKAFKQVLSDYKNKFDAGSLITAQIDEFDSEGTDIGNHDSYRQMLMTRSEELKNKIDSVANKFDSIINSIKEYYEFYKAIPEMWGKGTLVLDSTVDEDCVLLPPEMLEHIITSNQLSKPSKEFLDECKDRGIIGNDQDDVHGL